MKASLDTLRCYFSGLTENAFVGSLGVADPPMVDYLSEMLARFVRMDVVYRVRDLAGQRLEDVTTMALEGEERISEARREVHRHVGDFTLFWAGVYPEALDRLRAGHSADYLIDYCEQGKRSYYIASTIPTDDADAPNAVLRRLSSQFEMCVYGLNEVRREWDRRESTN